MRAPAVPFPTLSLWELWIRTFFRLGLMTEFSSGLFSGIRTVEMSLEVASPMKRRDFLAALALLRTSRIGFKGGIWRLSMGVLIFEFHLIVVLPWISQGKDENLQQHWWSATLLMLNYFCCCLLVNCHSTLGINNFLEPGTKLNRLSSRFQILSCLLTSRVFRTPSFKLS